MRSQVGKQLSLDIADRMEGDPLSQFTVRKGVSHFTGNMFGFSHFAQKNTNSCLNYLLSWRVGRYILWGKLAKRSTCLVTCRQFYEEKKSCFTLLHLIKNHRATFHVS